MGQDFFDIQYGIINLIIKLLLVSQQFLKSGKNKGF